MPHSSITRRFGAADREGGARRGGNVLGVDLYYPEPYLYVDGGSVDFHGGGG